MSIADGIHPARSVRWLILDSESKTLTLVASNEMLTDEERDAEHRITDLFLKILINSEYENYKIKLSKNDKVSEVVGVLIGNPVFFIATNKKLLED